VTRVMTRGNYSRANSSSEDFADEDFSKYLVEINTCMIYSDIVITFVFVYI